MDKSMKFSRVLRLPPYVFAEVDKLKMSLRRADKDIIDLGMGNPDLPTPPHVVDKLLEAAQKPSNHRYSASRGIAKLRAAIANWYRNRYDVDIDPESEVVVTMGAKEGISHLVLSLISPGDVVFAPNPTYPIHPYSVIIAGGDLRSIPIEKNRDFFQDLQIATEQTWPRPKMLIISFPHNPTTEVVDLEFFQKICNFAKENDIIVVHDFAYADLVFDRDMAPSFLQIDGAKTIGVEFFSMSKSYSMPGWRVGFCIGNSEIIAALTRIKSYLDYGIFQPVQIAAIIALNSDQSCVKDIVNIYRSRRDVLVDGLNRSGWPTDRPKATMFVWAGIPEKFQDMGSVEFSKFLIREAGVAVSPGRGFGEYGDGYVRFALVENEERIRQAIRGIRRVLR
ncbi:MAG: aminotransferase class I/II-fold pyridoxal phosphate-dependent enzyme [Desulfobacterales bacterium]|jgi:alanine-synthesizing transaminase|nr:alanine transaminase [Desulfobacter sp.]MDP6394846.1 aminotransferase class I/II-fold pyridoxal phosphate-dependent enzyme [Desulfobacterales bacterium]MDP6682017.1 aminotransferase class I/II-fold pyridoxal phosphate-dependent enzyme [Desulfobacterales bacterium]MDP6807685.1 aminotransferase class I/II-fold pyridoxal phosphate-dependent enzyme [Desulfobacterales bacterium]|tara:strand:+ start:993 stop:2171 length:1179 start_codon:yes stop_codon:yes gene_type:complete